MFEKFKRAFTALLVGSILAIMIGSVLLVISYVVINAIIGSTGTISNAALNTSLYANITNITAALNIAGIALIVVGISGIKAVRGVKLSTLSYSLYAHRPWGRRRKEVITPLFLPNNFPSFSETFA